MGSYLFKRVLSSGHDSRFEGIRDRPAAFAGAFAAQAAWVTLMLAPVIALNAVVPGTALAAGAAASSTGVRVTDVLGLGTWIVGFGFEAVADAQKSRWAREKRDKVHDEAFMTSGLFSVRCVSPPSPRPPSFTLSSFFLFLSCLKDMCERTDTPRGEITSRFPHYFGEITLWTGLATFSAGALAAPPAQAALGLGGGAAGILATSALCFVAPAFSTFLLTRVSGIPMSEGKYDKRYGNRADYQAWKRDTPRLVPKLW